MKKFLLFIYVSCSFFGKAQAVFCPPGAEWHFTFSVDMSSAIFNEAITYTHDSVIGTNSYKVLQHSKFFNMINFGPNGPTLIKQVGDTIFMRNARTQHAWQVLYNFNAIPGSGWQNTLIAGVGSSSAIVNYTFIVDSVKFTNVNNINLKQLFVRHKSSYSNFFAPTTTITERFGSSIFLFNYENHVVSDGDYINEFLCYQDNAFGLSQFSSKPCNYSNPVGISEETMENLKIYPNPSSGILYIESPLPFSENSGIKITDLLGKEVVNSDKVEQTTRVDVSQIKKGIYFLYIYEDGKLIAREKFVKD
jgi:hypothetical protein